jgi:predicted  nucleic acid-binding Zn-ribbon protein
MGVKLNIEHCQKIAAEKGGECLSLDYKNSQTRVLWRCNCGHEWEAIPNNVIRGSWCPRCGIKKQKAQTNKYSIEYCKRIAIEHNGLCLSDIYINPDAHMLWKCGCGNEWKTTFDVIRKGAWCPKCGFEKKKITCFKKYGYDHQNKNPEMALKAARKMNNPSIKYHWFTNEELVCQGSWEAQVVDHLNLHQINYKWQPETFKLSTGKTYRPDLLLTDTQTWVEIKGFMRDDAKIKWEEFINSNPTAELWDKNKLKELEII